MVKHHLFTDSSFLVALYSSGDNQHNKAIKIGKSLQKKSVVLYLHSLIILESLTVIKQKSASENLALAKESLFDPHAYVQLAEKYYLERDSREIDIFEEFPKISLVDAKIVDLCLTSKLTLLTFDQNLARAAGKAGVKTF